MKKCKNIYSLILSVILILCLTMSAAAATTRASDYLSRYSAYVNPDGNGNVSVWFEVQGVHTMDEIGVLTIRIQEKPSGSSTWTTVQTFMHTDYPELLEYNDSFHWGHVDYSGTKGYSYRAYVTVWAGEDGDGDSRVITTEAIIAD
jgi:hypothetical protein